MSRSRSNVPSSHSHKPLIPLTVTDLLDMPESKFALAWNKFGEQYGPLTWLTVVGQPLLILNSFEASKELLGSRGSIYIDRPRSAVTAELLGECLSSLRKRQTSVLTLCRIRRRHAICTIPARVAKAAHPLEARTDRENCKEGLLRTTIEEGQRVYRVLAGPARQVLGRIEKVGVGLRCLSGGCS